MIRARLLPSVLASVAVANVIGLGVFAAGIRDRAALALSVVIVTVIGVVAGAILHVHYHLEGVDPEHPDAAAQVKHHKAHGAMWAVVMVLLLLLYLLQFVPFFVRVL